MIVLIRHTCIIYNDACFPRWEVCPCFPSHATPGSLKKATYFVNSFFFLFLYIIFFLMVPLAPRLIHAPSFCWHLNCTGAGNFYHKACCRWFSNQLWTADAFLFFTLYTTPSRRTVELRVEYSFHNTLSSGL